MSSADDGRVPEAPPAAARFRVTIYYREPTYARSRGIPDREYQGTFEVVAADTAEAVTLAIEEFRAAARRASVGWSREIVRVSIAPGAGS